MLPFLIILALLLVQQRPEDGQQRFQIIMMKDERIPKADQIKRPLWDVFYAGPKVKNAEKYFCSALIPAQRGAVNTHSKDGRMAQETLFFSVLGPSLKVVVVLRCMW